MIILFEFKRLPHLICLTPKDFTHILLFLLVIKFIIYLMRIKVYSFRCADLKH
jgi:hypothetical protein